MQELDRNMLKLLAKQTQIVLGLGIQETNEQPLSTAGAMLLL